jgi:hypothetical protein
MSRPGAEAIVRGDDGFYHSASGAELAALVTLACRDGRQPRVRGAAHSVSHAVYGDPSTGWPTTSSSRSRRPVRTST